MPNIAHIGFSVRMAERSKAPDSSESFSSNRDGRSGPRKRAWVQIPLLTNFLTIKIVTNRFNTKKII